MIEGWMDRRFEIEERWRWNKMDSETDSGGG
jgi:hypothetical protein